MVFFPARALSARLASHVRLEGDAAARDAAGGKLQLDRRARRRVRLLGVRRLRPRDMGGARHVHSRRHLSSRRAAHAARAARRVLHALSLLHGVSRTGGPAPCARDRIPARTDKRRERRRRCRLPRDDVHAFASSFRFRRDRRRPFGGGHVARRCDRLPQSRGVLQVSREMGSRGCGENRRERPGGAGRRRRR